MTDGTSHRLGRLVGVTAYTTVRANAVTDREAAYTGLFMTQFRRLVQLAVLLGDDDPENVVQEAFVRLHARRDRLRDDNAALTYLRRTVVNLCHSKLRHLRVVRRAPVEIRPDLESAEQTAVSRERSREVVAALQRIPRRQRDVLVLRYWAVSSVASIVVTDPGGGKHDAVIQNGVWWADGTYAGLMTAGPGLVIDAYDAHGKLLYDSARDDGYKAQAGSCWRLPDGQVLDAAGQPVADSPTCRIGYAWPS